MTETSESGGPGWTDDVVRDRRRRLYQELRAAGTDLDALHQLIERSDGAILDRAVPYVLVATRNRLRSTWRSDSSRTGREQEVAGDRSGPSTDALDPAERVIARGRLDEALEALASLEERDAWALWWHAGGFDDREIAELWDDAGFEPPSPKGQYLRTRRTRARARLRSILGDGSAD